MLDDRCLLCMCFTYDKTTAAREKWVKGTQRHFTSGRIQETRRLLIISCRHKGELLRKHKGISLF